MANTTNTTTEILGYDISVDPRKGVKEVQNFERNFSERMRRVRKSIRSADEGMDKLRKHMEAAQIKRETTRGLATKIQSLTEQREKFPKIREDALRAARAAPRGSAERKQHMQTAKEMGEAVKQIDVELPAHQRAHARLVEDEEFDPAELREAGARAGEKMIEPFEDFFAKDAIRLIKRVNKILFFVPKKLMNTIISPDRRQKWGDAVFAKGMALREKGAERKERGKKLLKSGQALKGAATMAGGGITKVLGTITQLMSSLGPMMTMLGTVGMALVKLALDAEAGAKNFNKQLLQTSSTSGYLVRSFGDTAKATADLDNTLTAAREGANDLNLQFKWGVSPEVAGQYLSAVSNAGVALEKMGQAHTRAAVSSDEYTKNIKMGVAYSRQFGVSLSELADLQGQMMADLGMNADQTLAGFQRIVEGAAEAGMESQKFFGIVRSFSSDLSLFSLRLGDVTKLLGVLGKTMDPRKIGDFVHQLHGAVDSFDKGIEVTFITGQEGREIAEAGLAETMDALADTIRAQLGADQDPEKAIAELKDAMKIQDANDRTKAIGRWNSMYHMTGEIAGTIVQVATATKRMASGDPIDMASILKMLSPMKQGALMDLKIRKIFGVGIEGLQKEQLKGAEEQGISLEYIQANEQLRTAIVQSQQDFMNRLTAKDDKGRPVAIQPKDLQQLAKMKLNPAEFKNREELAAAVDKWTKDAGGVSWKGFEAWFKVMDKTDSEALENGAKVAEFQEDASDLQVSMLDRLGMIADYLLNKIYKVLMWIYKLIVSFVNRFKWSDEAKLSRAQAVASGSTDTKLNEIFDRKLSLDDTKRAVAKEFAPRAHEAATRALAEYNKIQTRLAAGKDSPQAQQYLRAKADKLKPVLKYKKQIEMGGKYFTDVVLRDLINGTKSLDEQLEELTDMFDVGKDVVAPKKEPEKLKPNEVSPYASVDPGELMSTDTEMPDTGAGEPPATETPAPVMPVTPITTAQAQTLVDGADAISSLPEDMSKVIPEAFEAPLEALPDAIASTPPVPPAELIASSSEPTETNVRTEVVISMAPGAKRHIQVMSQDTTVNQSTSQPSR